MNMKHSGRSPLPMITPRYSKSRLATGLSLLERRASKWCEGIVKEEKEVMELWRTRDIIAANIREARDTAMQTAVETTTDAADKGTEEIVERIVQHTAD